MANTKKSQKKKNPHRKPVSLFPLDFKEALSGFLKVPSTPKEEMDKAIEKHETKKKKPK
jgi:hypothetical protein